MDDLISRQAAIDYVDCGHLRPPTELAWSDLDVVNMLKRLPSAEPEPSQVARDIATIIENEKDMRVISERKTGRWIHREDMDFLDENKVEHIHFMCSECGLIHDFLDWHTAQYNYCPNCGARMEAEHES